MQYLRSPAVHCLDPDPYGLRRFADSRHAQHLRPRFAAPYERPSLRLFRAHCEHLSEVHGLQAQRLRGRALALQPLAAGGFAVETDQGQLRARRVVLALGLSEQPLWPAFTQSLSAAQPGLVEHLFQPQGFTLAPAARGGPEVVIGGGISAAQAAVALAALRPGEVTLLARHPLRVHQFDSDPGWLGGNLPSFRALSSLPSRRAALTSARHRGSLPPDVARALKRAEQAGALQIIIDPLGVTEATAGEGDAALRLGSGATLRAARVVLATGFAGQRPGGRFIDDAIARLGLRCAPCGYPVLPESLTWAPDLFVSGPLAELEIGPAARNIAGARMASQRIARGY